GRFQGRYRRLLTVEGAVELLAEHGLDFGVIVDAKTARHHRRRAGVYRNQIAPITQILVIALISLLECLLGQRQKARALEPVGRLRWLGEPVQELDTGRITFFGKT